MITKKQFRWLLIVYFLTILSSEIVSHFTKSMIPQYIKVFEPDVPTHSIPILFFLIVILITIIIAHLIGLIGMFLFWSPSRNLFFISSICIIFLAPIMYCPWSTVTGYESLISGLRIFIQGLIVSTSLIGPAKHLFFKNQQHEINEPIKGNN